MKRIKNITQKLQAEEKVTARGRGGGGKLSQSNKTVMNEANFAPISGEIYPRSKYEAWKDGKDKWRWHSLSLG